MTEFWRKWLIGAAAVTALAGLTFAAITIVGATSVHDEMFDLVHLPGELEAPAGEVAAFAIGVAGAVMVGWATMMVILLRSRNGSTEPALWRALTMGLVAWFVVDGVVSLSAGAIGNVVLNTGFAAMFAPALIATRSGGSPQHS